MPVAPEAPPAPPSTSAARPEYRKLGHTPALDGLRAIAIVAVMLFHFPTRALVVGGLFGVDMFFALSGFLITALLLAEFGRRGRVDLPAFLARRGWRLVPALFAFLALYLVADLLFGHTTWFASDPFGNRIGQPVPFHLAFKGVYAAATYSLNQMRAGAVVLPPITHLWSLSVEGQFYVTFPILMVIILRTRRGLLLPVTVVLAALSASMPWVLWHGGSGADLVYFGSVTRVQGLLIGSVAAQLWSRGWTRSLPLQLRRLLALAGGVTLLWIFLKVGNVQFKYLGAILVASVAGALLVIHFAEPTPVGRVGRVLGSRPLVWLGQRSYAVYLWHYVFDCWTNPLPHDVGVPLGIGASLVVAELSWRLVEAPAQRLASRRRQARADLAVQRELPALRGVVRPLVLADVAPGLAATATAAVSRVGASRAAACGPEVEPRRRTVPPVHAAGSTRPRVAQSGPRPPAGRPPQHRRSPAPSRRR